MKNDKLLPLVLFLNHAILICATVNGVKTENDFTKKFFFFNILIYFHSLYVHPNNKLKMLWRGSISYSLKQPSKTLGKLRP